jgi:hypothetical protein
MSRLHPTFVPPRRSGTCADPQVAKLANRGFGHSLFRGLAGLPAGRVRGENRSTNPSRCPQWPWPVGSSSGARVCQGNLGMLTALEAHAQTGVEEDRIAQIPLRLLARS